MKPGIDYIGVTVVFLCHDGKGNILMQKRGQNCRDEQGRWDIGGGKLEIHETPEEAVRKEIAEEYGTDTTDIQFHTYRDVHREQNGEKTHWIALDFTVLVDREKVKNGEPHKFDEIGWFTADTLPLPLHSQIELELDAFKERINNL